MISLKLENNRAVLPVTINNIDFPIVLDSGASKSFLPAMQYKGKTQHRSGESVTQATDVKKIAKDLYVSIDSARIGD